MTKKFAVTICVLLVMADVLANRDRPIEFKFQQSDYKIEFQRVELAHYNKQIISQYDLRTFKYNRTCTAVNITKTYNIDLGNDEEIIFQAYKFMSNEYRHFPMRFQINFCSALSQNYAGFGRLLACGNFSGCPMKKNTRYHFCNFSPDQDQFPPLIPDGEYMLEMQWLYHSIELFVLRGYGKIFRPIAIP